MDFEKAYHELKAVLTAFKVDAEKHDAEHAAQLVDLRGRVESLSKEEKRLVEENRGLQQRLHALDEKYGEVLRENIELFNQKVARENGLEEELKAASDDRYLIGRREARGYEYLTRIPVPGSPIYVTLSQENAVRLNAGDVERILSRLEELHPNTFQRLDVQ